MKGLVLSVHGKSVRLLVDGKELRATMSGKAFRGIFPSAGDLAVVTVRKDGCSTLEEILPRRNCLRRPFPGGVQVIAANLDLAIVLVSIIDPPLRRGFIDRNTASALFEGITVVLAVNKMDLAEEEDLRLLDALERDCTDAGIAIFRTSCQTGDGLPAITQLLQGRTVVLTGPSGAGKTSLVKALGGPVDLRTGELNTRTRRGTHTTVAATLVRLPGDVMLVDTPGLRAFPIDHIPADQLQFCFRDFDRFRDDCRFRNCLHRNEPGCAVKQAAGAGALSAERYSSYLQLLAEVSGG
jgi:ribosome biogenesis GTPase / thiamine phosphate phosphatase